MQTIEVENLGPIAAASIKLPGPGITVITGPNGVGKSILLDGVSKLAANGGKVPLKDGEKKGSLTGFGARLSIGHNCRHTGEVEVTHLEGKFDIAGLVDPGLKDAKASDRHRIKALVTLMGVRADIDLFAKSPAMGSRDLFEATVAKQTAEVDDLCEMAARVKRDYEQEARRKEDDATKEIQRARGIEEALRTVDTSCIPDESALRNELEAAIREKATLEERQKQYRTESERVATARKNLETAKTAYTGPSVAQAAIALEQAVAATQGLDDEIEAIRQRLAAAEKNRDAKQMAVQTRRHELSRAKEYASIVEQAEDILRQPSAFPVTVGEFEANERRIAEARLKVEEGAVAKKALEQLAEARAHKARHADLIREAEVLRNAAAGTDEVLSQAIQCPAIRVEAIDGASRLVVDHPTRGKSKPYHELSEGERWKIAIDIAADRVGENGLIVLRQEAYESLDAAARLAIHQHAVERKVFVLTAEATHDLSEMEQGMLVKHLSLEA